MYNVNNRWDNRNKTKGNLMNPNPPQITSPGSIASKISQEEQKKLVPTTTIPNEVQPVIPDMDTKMPDPSEYHQFQDLYTELYENPITPEEEEKRKRSATAVEGIGHLGNVMNAFSNLIFTGKGAPSQELPKVPDEIQAFEDRMAEKRRMYANGMMGAKARDLQDWKDAYAMKRQEAIDKRNEALDKQKSQINEYNIKYQELRNVGYPAKLAADLALKQSQIEENKAGAYRNRKQGEAAVIRANKSSSSGSSPEKAKEVAYITKYGDVIFDNPNNKKAVTLSTLEVMRNKASADEKESINSIISKMREGDVDSYNDAEMYVSQHLNNDAVALKHLFEQAKKYGRVVGDEGQRKLRDKDRNAGDSSKSKKESLGWGKDKNNETDW